MFASAGLYAKAIFAALMAALTAVYGVLSGPNGEMTDKEWIAVAIAGFTALGVYLFPNTVASTNVKVRNPDGTVV